MNLIRRLESERREYYRSQLDTLLNCRKEELKAIRRYYISLLIEIGSLTPVEASLAKKIDDFDDLYASLAMFANSEIKKVRGTEDVEVLHESVSRTIDHIFPIWILIREMLIPLGGAI